MYLTTNFEINPLSNYNENTFIKMDRYVQVLCMCYQFGEHLQSLHKKAIWPPENMITLVALGVSITLWKLLKFQ